MLWLSKKHNYKCSFSLYVIFFDRRNLGSNPPPFGLVALTSPLPQPKVSDKWAIRKILGFAKDAASQNWNCHAWDVWGLRLQRQLWPLPDPCGATRLQVARGLTWRLPRRRLSWNWLKVKGPASKNNWNETSKKNDHKEQDYKLITTSLMYDTFSCAS